MNSANPLDNLRDIHLPAEVGIWPLAPGWWILLAIIVMAVAYSLYRVYQNYKRAAIKREAMAVITEIKVAYAEHNDPHKLLKDYSTLLRRIALGYQTRESVASVTGDNWTLLLEQLAGKSIFEPEELQLLAEGPYRRNVTLTHEPEQLAERINDWLDAVHRRHQRGFAS